MKKALRKGLSFILAITIILSSAYVGLSELDYGSLFSVKAKATDECPLTFTIDANSAAYSVTDCLSDYSGEVEIPESYNDLPVTAIGTDAFRDCAEITSVNIPDTVTSIGGSAFRNCTKLVKIDLPANITTIPGAMCFGCSALESVAIPADVTSVGGYAFSGCTALKYVFYNNDEAAWSGIAIGASNTALTDAVIHYNSTEHSFSTEWTVDAEATCTENGSKSRHCSVCDAKADIIVIDAIGHSFGAWNISKAPTCTEDGSIERVCSNCNSTEVSEELVFEKILDPSTYPESSHDYVNNMNKIYNFKYTGAKSLTITFSEKTETESGYDSIFVGSYDFGESGTGTYFAGKTITIYDDDFYIQLVSDGSVTRYGFSIDSIVAEMDVSAYGHSYNSEWTVDVEPTCTEEGSESRKCITCGEVATRAINANGHSFDWSFDCENATKYGVCSVCQYEMTDVMVSADALTFTLNSDGTAYSVSSCLIDYPGEVVIPESYKGLPVTAIDRYCFRNHELITSVVIPDSVTEIGTKAFINCAKLESITIGSGVKTIMDNTFSRCHNLKNVYISDVAAWCGIDFSDAASNVGNSNPFCFAENLYLNGELVTDLVIPEGVTAIPYYAFQGVKNITSVTIPDSVTSIGESAFVDCTNLKEITIGSNVSTIGKYAFGGCTALEKVNWNAKKVNDFDGSTYIFACAGSDGEGVEIIFGDDVESIPSYVCHTSTNERANFKTIVIGKKVSSIGANAFAACKEIEEITIPFKVKSIGDKAFYNCTSLKSVVIPIMVESIGQYAFGACTSLESVTIGVSVKTIGTKAFSDCKNLKEVIWKAYGVTDFTSNSDVFYAAGVDGEGIDFVFANNVKTIPAYLCYSSYTSGSPKVNSVVIGSKTESVPNYAFYSCESLKTVELGENVTSIGAYAFYDCTMLESITIPKSVTSIGSKAFYNCTSLNDVYISDIGAWCNISYPSSNAQPMFYAKNMYLNGEPITEVVIPEGVTRIRDYSFYGCSSITSVKIPASVEYIYYTAFACCPNIEGFIVDENNQDYYSVDGVLFEDSNYDTTEHNYVYLLYYPATKTDESYVIPDNVDTIYPYAFAGAKFKTITVPSGIDYVASNAFVDCVNVEKIYWNAKAPANFDYDGSVFSNVGTAGNGVEIVFGDTVEKIPDYFCYTAYGYISPNIVSVIIGDNVTTIGKYAFYGCNSLENVVVGDGVTKIDGTSFKYCQGLKSLEIGNNVSTIDSQAFYYCKNLETITIGENVTSVGEYAFSCCYNLKKVNWNAKNAVASKIFTNSGTSGDGIEFVFGDAVEKIPDYLCDVNNNDTRPKVLSVTMGDNVKDIGSRAFYSCSDLESVKMGNSMPNVGDCAFYQCSKLITFENKGLGDIGEYAFYGCQNFTQVTISDSSTSIGEDAFYGCVNISRIVIPDSVTSLGASAFYGCTRLNSVTIGNGIKEIPSSAFYNCDALKAVEIPSGVTAIYNNAFAECSSLENVTIPNSVNSIGFSAFSYCSKLKEITIPYGVTCIENFTFSNCSELEAVTIPETVTSIGNYAFNYCSNLEEINLPNGLTSIGYSAFYYCIMIKEINIPNGVTSIGSNTFYGCASLEKITIPETVTDIAENAFYSCNNIKEINVDENNPSFSSVDGVLFNKDKTKLIKYPGKKEETEYTIPDTVKEIAARAFQCNWYYSTLDAIIIPVSVINIGYYAFYYDDYGWYDFPEHYFFYMGSERDWEGVAIGEGNNLLTRTALHYNATEHTFEEVIDETPGCVAEGTKHQQCVICGACENYEAIPSTGHSFTEWIVNYSPTCTEYGCKHRYCSICDTYEENYISPIGHNCNWEYDTESFTKTGTCSNCDETFTEAMTEVDVITFTLNSAGTAYTVTDCLVNYPGEVVIPGIYKGLPVTAIGTDAFRDCTEITSVIIPDSVTSVGGSAFRNCTGLKEVVLSENMTSIPGAILFGCKALESIVVYGGVTSFGGYAFSGCTALKYVFYEKAEADWAKITFGSSNEPLTAAPVHFNSTGEHTYSDEWTVDSLPTCSEPGITSRHCIICDAKTDIIESAATGHSYGEWVLKKNPTCAEDGLAERVCGICQGVQDSSQYSVEELVDSSLYPESEHNYSNNAHEMYEFSYDGAESLTITFSADTHTEYDYDFICIYDANGELYGEYSGSALANKTITLEGSYFTIELTSDYSYSEYGFSIDSIVADMGKLSMVKPLGHKYELTSTSTEHPHAKNYSCSVCGATKTENEAMDDCVECNFVITPLDDNSYKLVSYIGSSQHVVVPATYKGKAITTIGNSCFKGKPVVSVTIEDGVTSIGDIVFMQCMFLQKVYIPESVTSIGANIFAASLQATIYCKKDSAAHQHAVDNNMRFVLISILETENTTIDYENLKVNTTIENCGDISKIVGLSENVLAIPTASYVYGATELYGTGTVISVFDGNDYIGDFTLVVQGDTNGDSVCDVLDCFDVERASNGSSELSGAYADAGDVNGDGVIDVNDYQAITNKAVS